MTVAEWTCYASMLPALGADDTLRLAEAAALPWLPDRERRRSLHRLQSAVGLDDADDDVTPIEGLRVVHEPAPESEHTHA